jgi:hypothetical protein
MKNILTFRNLPLLLACSLAAQPASGALKIIPVFIGGTPPPAEDVRLIHPDK